MRIFADGVFDFYHRGHREHFHRLKNISDSVYLMIGVISDEECTTYKRTPTMNENHRLKLISKDKNVNHVEITPLVITREFLEKNEIDFVYHAFASDEDAAKQQDCFKIPREMGIFRTVPYVQGISSSEILSQWENIWQKKGTVQSNDLRLLNGYEDTSFDGSKAWEKIKNVMGIENNDEILEVGCGAGYIAQNIENVYVGIDPSQSLIHKHHSILNNTVCVGHAHDLPFDDNSFDYVIVIGICAYFKDKVYTAQAISEFSRVAKKGIYIGNIRHSSEGKRSKHIYDGPTEHLLHDMDDFPDFKSDEPLYDSQYYFCCYKHVN